MKSRMREREIKVKNASTERNLKLFAFASFSRMLGVMKFRLFHFVRIGFYFLAYN